MATRVRFENGKRIEEKISTRSNLRKDKEDRYKGQATSGRKSYGTATPAGKPKTKPTGDTWEDSNALARRKPTTPTGATWEDTNALARGDVATPELDSFSGTKHNAGMSHVVNASQAARQSVMPSAWGSKEGQDKKADAVAELAAALTSGKPTGDTWEDENAAARLADKRREQVKKITGDWTGDAALYLQTGGDLDEAAVRGTEAMGARAASGAIGGSRNMVNMAGYLAQDAADTAKDTARAVGVNEQFAADFDNDPNAMKPFNEWRASLNPGEYEALEMSGQLPDPRQMYADAKQAEAERKYRAENGELELHRLTDMGEDFQKKVQEDYGDIEGGWKVAGDIAETLGQQAPAMALHAIPGAGAALSAAYLFGSAGGGATEQALQEGAKAEDALSYGVMSGLMEAATEKMFDGMAGLMGKGAADDAIESLLKNINNTGARNLARWGLGAAGEGAEELVSAIADPALKTIYNNQDIATSYNKNFDWGDTMYQAAMGVLSGGLMGSVGLVNGQYQAKNNTIEAQIAAEMANNIAADPNAMQTVANIQSNAQTEAQTEAPVEQAPAKTTTQVLAQAMAPTEQAEQAPTSLADVERRARQAWDTPYEDEYGTHDRPGWNTASQSEKFGAALMALMPDVEPLDTSRGSSLYSFMNDLVAHGGDLNPYAAAQAFVEAYNSEGKLNARNIVQRAYELAGQEMPRGIREEYFPTAEEQAAKEKRDAEYRKGIESYKRAKDLAAQKNAAAAELASAMTGGAQATSEFNAPESAQSASPAEVMAQVLQGQTTPQNATEAVTTQELAQAMAPAAQAEPARTIEDARTFVKDFEALEDDYNRRLNAWNEANNNWVEDYPYNEEWKIITQEKKQLDEQRDQYNAEKGRVNVDKGNVSPGYGTPENFIGKRYYGELGDRSIKAFQHDHPELHRFFAEEAKKAAEDVTNYTQIASHNSKKGTYYTTPNKDPAYKELSRYGMSTEGIALAMEDVVKDRGKENAAAKRAELYLHKRMMGQVRKADGSLIPANQEYIEALSKIPGAAEAMWEMERDSMLNVMAWEGVSDEEADAEIAEWEKEHPRPGSQPQTAEAPQEQAAEGATTTQTAEEAAKERGFTKKLYHGSHGYITFEPGHSSGLYNFAENKQNAASYAMGSGGGRNSQDSNLFVLMDDPKHYGLSAPGRYDYLVFEKDPDTGNYRAVGTVNDEEYSGGNTNVRDLPPEYANQTLNAGSVEDSSEEGGFSPSFSPLAADASTREFYVKADHPLDLTKDQKTATSVFRALYNNLNNNQSAYAQKYGLNQEQINVILNQLAGLVNEGQTNDFDLFWQYTKHEYATHAFRDYIVPELKELGYDSFYFSDDSHKTWAVFDVNQIFDPERWNPQAQQAAVEELASAMTGEEQTPAVEEPAEEPTLTTPAEQVATPVAPAPTEQEIAPAAPPAPPVGPAAPAGNGTLGIRPDKNVTAEDGSKPSQTVETAQAAEVTTDEFSELINQEKEKGGFRYMPLSNDESTQRATEKIKRMGWSAALTAWSNDVRRGKAGAEMTATGALLYNNAVNSGDKKLAIQLLGDYALMGRNTAQGLQAFKILKTLTPDNQLYAIENQLAKLSEQLKGKLPEGVTLSEELKEAYMNATTDEARDAVLDQMMQDVANQIPATFKDKWTALRYMNMLGNFRTQGRNIIGNTLMAGTTATKNLVLRGLEGIAKAVNPNYERTVSLTADPALYKEAMQEFKENAKFISGESKYADNTFTGNDFMQGVQDKRKIFSFAPAEAYRKATTFATEAGDRIFIGPRYARSLAGYLQANGIDAQTFAGIRDGSIQPTPEQQALLDRARNFAMKDAQESTFHDSNWLSDWVSKIGRRPGTKTPIRILSEGLMPFRKTPANVAMRMAEYSPIGLVEAAYKTVRSQTKGDVSSQDILNTTAKGLTGTGLFLLGMLLRSSGRLRGHEDDEKQAAFDSLRGAQDYSLVFDDGSSVTMDWASPVASTVFMGSQMYDLIQEGGFQLEDLGEMFTRLTDPLIQMSMLQGVNDAMENLRYSNNSLGQVALNMGMSYLTQGLTNSMLGQAERTAEDRRYTTFRDSTTPFGRNFQQTLGKASAKTPGFDFNQIEYVDAWGRTEDTGNPFARAVNNFLNPGFVSSDNSTPVDDELQRLYDSGFGSVFPQRRGMTEKISTYDANGKRTGERSLTADEYVTYQKTKGQTSLKMVQSLMNSPVYEAMSDDAKAKAISDIYKYAGNQAARAVEPSTKNDYEEISNLSDPAAYYGAKAAFDDATGNRFDRDYEAVEYLVSGAQDLPDDVLEHLYDKKPELEKVSKAYEAGCPVRVYYHAADAVKDLEPIDGSAGVKSWQKYQAVLDSVMDTKQADILMESYMQDGTYMRYQTARAGGIKPQFFVEAYRAYTENNTRKGAFTEWMKKQGYNENSTNYMYAILHGNLGDLSGLNAKYNKHG